MKPTARHLWATIIFHVLALVPAGLAATFGDTAPTMSTDVNTAYRFVLTYTLVISLYASPFWLRIVAPILLAGFADSNWALAAAVLALAATQATYRRNKTKSTKSALLYIGCGLSGCALIDLQDRITAFTALAIAVAVSLAAGVYFYRSLPTTIRRLGTSLLLLGSLGLAGLTAGYGYEANQHAKPLRALSTLGGSDSSGRSSLERLDDSTSDALADLNSTRYKPLEYLPILSQNTVTARELLTSTNELAEATTTFLEQQPVNTKQAAPTSGPSEELAFKEDDNICQRFTDFHVSIQEAAERKYLAKQIRRQLNSLDSRLSRVARLGETCEAARLLKDQIISGEPQTYLVLLMTTAETRGIGGLFTNWATVEFGDGSAKIVDAGRSIPLNNLLEEVNAKSPLPEDVAQMWGPYEFDTHFQDLGATPDGELIADTAQSLFTQAKPGTELSGVMILGPEALASLVSLGGGAELQGERLDGAGTVEFLTKGQYELNIPLAERVILLDTLLQDTMRDLSFDIDAFTDVDLDLFADSLAAGELVVIPNTPAQRALFRDAEMTSSLPARSETQLFGIVEQNAGLDKLDPYLERQATLTWRDRTDTEPKLKIRYTNKANTDLPEYVLGFSETPAATNRLRTAVYAPVQAANVTVNVESEELPEPFVYYGSEKGHAVSLVTTDVAPGSSVDVTYSFTDWPVPPEPLSILRPPAYQERSIEVKIESDSWLIDTTRRLSSVKLS